MLDNLIKLNDDFIKSNKNYYNVWIVANVIDTVQNKEDFVMHTNFSEFFSKAEFASIASAIIERFGYSRIFYSELELILCITNNIEHLDINKIIVFNFSRDGAFEGKKSLIPAFCNLFGIKYIGSNPFVISLLRNKFIYTNFLSSIGLKVPKTTLYSNGKLLNYNLFDVNDKIIIKNVFESASIGMSENNIVKYLSLENISCYLKQKCKEMSTSVLLIQEYIKGYECEVFVIKYENLYYAFDPIMIDIHNSDIITDDISNDYDYTFSLLSKTISKEICNKIRIESEKCAEYLNINDYARFDYRIDNSGQFYLIDIAGSPYLTKHSSIEYLFTKVLNLNYSDIFSMLIALSVLNYSHEVNCKSDNNSPREK